MLLEYFPGTSFLHRADVRSKLLLFVAVMVASFLNRSPLPNLVVAAVAVFSLLYLGVEIRTVTRLFSPLALVMVFVFAFAIFSPPIGADSTVVCYVLPNHRLALTIGGLAYGTNLILRILIMVAATAALVLSTPLEQFTTLLQSIKAPHAVVFIIVTSLRFVPTLQGRSNQILDAQRARGARVDGGGVFNKVRAYVTIMVPLFATGIRMSEELSAAMVSRGYGVTKYPTQLYDLGFGWRDVALISVSLALVFGAIALRITGMN